MKPDIITDLILKRLAVSETRTLTLTVSLRGELENMGGYRGDLSRAVKGSLARLIKAKRIRDADGAYSLVR